MSANETRRTEEVKNGLWRQIEKHDTRLDKEEMVFGLLFEECSCVKKKGDQVKVTRCDGVFSNSSRVY